MALYLKGLSSREVGRHLGIRSDTIRTWAMRYGWTEARTNSSTIASPVPQSIASIQSGPELEPQATDESCRTKETLARQILRLAESLGERPVKHPKTAAELAGVIRTLVDAASKVHAWDQGATSVNIRCIDEVRKTRKLPEGMVIDVVPLK
jgi:hypothetical protein